MLMSLTMIQLNEFGMAVWYHKTNQCLFAQRSYDWVDRIIVLDETDGRKVVEDTLFSIFDFSEWMPMTVEEYQRVKSKYKEIHDV